MTGAIHTGVGYLLGWLMSLSTKNNKPSFLSEKKLGMCLVRHFMYDKFSS